MFLVCRTSSLAVAAALLVSGVAGAQPDGPECLNWEQAASGGPPPRSGHAMAYDEARGVTVLFGGTDGPSLLADTWEWDGEVWTPREPAGDRPERRMGHAMAFDQASGKVLLFGGQGSEVELDDTWLWDGVAGVWAQVAEGAPGPRSYAAMSGGGPEMPLLLFGGTEDGVLLNDLWAWDGEVWTFIYTPDSPSSRRDHAMAYCPLTSQFIVFGGWNGQIPLGDTWIWDGSSWNEGPSGPPVRHMHAMATDAFGGAVMFGGNTPARGPLNDCWHYYGDAWELGPTGPEGRASLGLAYDAARYATVLFGGMGAGLLGDTWELEVAEPVVTSPPKDAAKCVGGSAVFIVKASGTGEMSYQWLKNDVPLIDGGHISGATSDVLSIYPVGPADQGYYYAFAYDDCGVASSPSATLTVLAKTQINRHPADANVVEGGGVSFMVEAVGEDLTYRWYKDGQPLVDGPRIGGSHKSLLTIDPVQLSDAGSYHVEVMGHCGTLLSDVAVLDVRPDRDGDGIPDDSDNCPDVPNEQQLDRDGDLVGDACDGCPDDPNKTEPGICGCGVPEVDSDDDGTPDCADGCPDDPDKIEPGACGCGDPDDDGDDDGVPDCVDNCPTAANADQADADGDGIGDLCDDDQAGREPPQTADSAFIRGLIDLITAADQQTDDSDHAMDVIGQALSSMDQTEDGDGQQNQDSEQTEADDQAARLDVLAGICPAASTTLLALTLLGLSLSRRGPRGLFE